MNCHLLAAIDLGTNTARLLIGSVYKGDITRSHILRKITRLGGGFTREFGISAEAKLRTVDAMREFADAIAAFRPSRTVAVATSAVRDAVNSQDFCNEVYNETGIRLEVINGETEGKMTLDGVLSGVDAIPDSLFLFDIGGGSTEYTVAINGRIVFTRSLPLGVVRLTEGKSSLSAVNDKISRELAMLKEELDTAGFINQVRSSTLIGTAGTATTLAAISLQLADYDYQKVNNHRLSISDIQEIYNRLVLLSTNERLNRITGLEPGREDLIIAGTLLTLNTMNLFGLSTLKVSDFGLLEGALLELARREGKQESGCSEEKA